MRNILRLLVLTGALALIPIKPAWGAPADLDYFKQFLYRVDINDQDPDHPSKSYRYLMTGMAQIPMGHNKTLLPDVSVFLYGDLRSFHGVSYAIISPIFIMLGTASAKPKIPAENFEIGNSFLTILSQLHVLNLNAHWTLVMNSHS